MPGRTPPADEEDDGNCAHGVVARLLIVAQGVNDLFEAFHIGHQITAD